jgi:hypothetical protein
VDDGPIDPVQRRLAERRLLDALRRFHQREPLRADLRADALIARVRAAEPPRASAHRGRAKLTLSDGELRSVAEELVASGRLLRQGHRLRLPESLTVLDPVMRQRIDDLMAALRHAGAAPPSAESVALRVGLPTGLLEQLRGSGELVAVGPRIDFPRDAWEAVVIRLDELAAAGPISVRLLRDELGTTRRHAEAILRKARDRRGVG